jgi:hypothetical protein
VKPEHIEDGSDGRVAVRVHQIVRSADETQLLADTTVRHLFRFENGLISRFDID